MGLSAAFIRRPVATTLLTIGLALAGLFAYFKLPVAPLPQVDFPTISVTATMPGASPDTMAATVATPLERHLGVIADVTEMTSASSVGSPLLLALLPAIVGPQGKLPKEIRPSRTADRIEVAPAPTRQTRLPHAQRGNRFHGHRFVDAVAFCDCLGAGPVTARNGDV